MIKPNISWVEEHTPELRGKILVTLSMEGCIPELNGDAREANVRGGLGIYFGDKLEGLSSIGFSEAMGCMPLYQKRLVQSIINGRQHIDYKDVSYEDQPVSPVMDREGKPLEFDVWGWDSENTIQERQYHIKVYSICRGGTLLYLFYCPEVFDILYPDDKTHRDHGREHRFLQETVFAECVHELFKRLNIVPDILHLNEGHVAAAAAIIRGDKTFEKTAVVYTNHTVVPAGMERFSVDGLTGGDIARARYAMRFPWPNHHRLWRKFMVHQDGRCFIDFSKGAIEMCDVANGVSAEHTDVTETLFPVTDKRIESILNGSGDVWIMDELMEARLKGIEPCKEILLHTSTEGKARAFAEVKRRTAGMIDKQGHIIAGEGVTLDPDLPTVWMVRRMVQYKSQLPILKDIIHVVCANREEEVDTVWGRIKGLAMQVVVGGIAPQGSNEERWIEEFVDWMLRSELKGRFVFVPNADTALLKMKAIGADICINCPLPEQEACGTSDQRSARNGGINIATRSGGPPEYIEDGRSGMLVGPYESNDDFYTRAPKDILDKLKELSDMYYDHDNDDSTWLDMKLESYLASPKVTAAAMEQRYAGLYAQAIQTKERDLARMNGNHQNGASLHGLSNIIFRLRESVDDFLYHDPALEGWTVIAGSPYFDQRLGGQLTNWGRDTMVSLPGLCLESERFDVFRDVMIGYLGFVHYGVLPNLIGDGSKPRYNSVDGSLWLLWAMGKYLEWTKDYAFLDIMIHRRFHPYGSMTIQAILEEIIDTYRNGIEFEDIWEEDGVEKRQTIYFSMDGDHLIAAGNEHTQLTWMDVKPKVHKPVTSRYGKAVEINALWYNALKVMEDIRRHRGNDERKYADLAEKVRSAFVKFWNPKTGCLYDTIDGDPEQGKKIRPNQVFAVALGLLDSNKNRAVMGKIRQELVTPLGLRTLSPRDPDYHAIHNDEFSYHQGTVWPWLMGAFIEASIITYGRRKTFRILDGSGYFTTLLATLETFGSIPEVFDGNAYSISKAEDGKGCKAQAWNVAESMRGLSLLFSSDETISEDPKPTGTKIIYEMVLRDYYDVRYHVSGLQSALDELPFLSESGIEYIYLLGLMKHAGNPFDIMDSFDIDSRAGTFADLEVFVSAAHAKGMKVIIDWLANQHVSKNSPLCKDHPDWFLYTDAKNGDYYVDNGMKLYTGRHRRPNDKKLVLVSATDEVPLRAFPRRWSSLAQPDLSHPELRIHTLEIGRFWLSKGLDGFRIDAALSTFPDKIKENWGINVEENLTRTFIEEMRKINPDCFIMFEGFERMEELLQLADHENGAVYNWRPRNLATDAIKEPALLPKLTAYLKELEYLRHIRGALVNLGPEHDAFDFEDPWIKLEYTERLWLYFIYAFMPGYMLIFNGQIFGRQHAYKREIDKTRPAPSVKDADKTRRETGKRLFSLRKEYPLLIQGSYKFLENDEQKVISLARFDEKEIVIGVININSDEKEIGLLLSDIIKGQLNLSAIQYAHYTQDVLLLKENTEGWISQTKDNIPAEKLQQEGLSVKITPRSCQVIRMGLSVSSNALLASKSPLLSKALSSDA